MTYLKVCAMVALAVFASGIFWIARAPDAAAVAPTKRDIQANPATFLGPTRGLVVLDPGHGGSNLGAPTVHADIYEKHVTLALANELAPRLRAAGFRVVMTRERDRYLSLRNRTQVANHIGADLFVSLHANATETHSQRGFESFVLTPEALDVDARALRVARSTSSRGLDLATERLLNDVERGMVHEPAIEVASAIQTQLRKVRGSQYDRGVRQGNHHVLLGANMPAVLVEVGFVDHPVEGPQLLTPETQKELAIAIARAVVVRLGS